ncbi:uncharacterized protein LOC133173567 [Saccostrea echinata]|uniref:uncharacterized protein LOC133173567 n=1 Tax=Saccostrea echinata TaxID=191078 RepID=UPI002A8235E4|nr:uncharacterized protein LOC133173567 [Saccostrea echinata]
MTLMSIRSEKTNVFLSNSLKASGHSAIWLGIFNNPSNSQEMIWHNNTVVQYNNFESTTMKTIDSMAANTTEATALCLYGDVTSQLLWKIAPCLEKLDFGCEIIGPGVNVLPALIPDAVCPDLVKMTSHDIARGSAFVDTVGRTRAGTFGYFKREDLVFAVGRRIGYDKTEDNIECVFRCLEIPGCNDVIILDKNHCLMYQR